MESSKPHQFIVLCHEGNGNLKVIQIIFRVISKDSVECIINELSLLKRLSHPFIVNLISAFHDSKKLYMIIDYLKGADLRYHICYKEIFSEA